MGLSGGSTKTTSTQTTDPSAQYAPYINSGAGALQSTYNQVAPVATQASNTLQSTLPTLASNITSGANTLGAANNYDQFVLGGGLLSGNPFLQAQIDATNQDVSDGVNSTFGAAGRTGSGAQTYALGRALANNETNLRYTDYGNTLNLMNSAAANAGNLSSTGLNNYLTGAGGAISLPAAASDQYASSLGSLLGRYTTTNGTSTTQTDPGLGSILGSALQIGSLFSPLSSIGGGASAAASAPYTGGIGTLGQFQFQPQSFVR